MTKQWGQDHEHFWICPRCDFHWNKRSATYEQFQKHLQKCAVEEVMQLVLELHPEVSDLDEEC